MNELMHTPIIYDLLGIGIGPFNLGLAALTENIENLRTLFLDENPAFHWHPGLLLPWARMQVPFHADLVTLADPCSKFSYLSFLKSRKRLFRFTILEKYFPLRSEYNDYCRWTVRCLQSLQFGFQVQRVDYDPSKKVYAVTARNRQTHEDAQFYARHLVVGVGSRPMVPDCIKDLMHVPHLIHSSDYLFGKKNLLETGDITVIGSGQSAAEIFFDLLQQYPDKIRRLSWITRSTIFPMDYSKFSCEMTSPDYVNFFFSLDPAVKAEALTRQDNLYKGINASLIQQIYDRLYLLSLSCPDLPTDIQIRPLTELRTTPDKDHGIWKMDLYHTAMKRTFQHETKAIILATGYENREPGFLQGVKDQLSFDDKSRLAVHRNYSIDRESKRIFIQNGDLHTHGFNAADLGLGVYRNIMIINSILGYEHYPIEDAGVFQTFSPTD